MCLLPRATLRRDREQYRTGKSNDLFLGGVFLYFVLLREVGYAHRANGYLALFK
jgi:hypothetical protein